MSRVFPVSAAITAACVALMLAGTSSAQSKDPVFGKWTFNAAKSKLNPDPTPKNIVLVFSPSGPDGVKLVVDGVSGTGEKLQWEYTGNYDGKDYPMKGNPEADAVTLKRINANSVETTYKLKGKVTLVNVRQRVGRRQDDDRHAEGDQRRGREGRQPAGLREVVRKEEQSRPRGFVLRKP